jgi:hypothetical protein
MVLRLDPTRLNFNDLDVPEDDYSSSIDPNKVLRDPRFLKDLKQYYAAKGDFVADDETLIEKFYSDKTWGDLNTVSAVGDAFEAQGAGVDQRGRMRRIENVWRQLPYFWQEGGRSAVDALGDGLGAILSDPINLIPGVSAYKAGATGARAALTAGKTTTQATTSGIRQGVVRGGLSEAAISAGQEAIVDTAQQARDIELGLQDEFSLARLGTTTAVGGVLGGAIGGAIGIPAGIAGARTGVDQVQNARRLGLDDAAIRGMSDSEITQFTDNTRDTAGLLTNEQGDTGTGQQPPGPNTDIDPIEAQFSGSAEKIQAQIDAHRRHVDNLKSSGVDNEIIAEAEGDLSSTVKLREMLGRLRREEEQIRKLEASNTTGDLSRAARMRSQFERDFSDFRVLLSQTDTTDVDALAARLQKPIEERANSDVTQTTETTTSETPPETTTTSAKTEDGGELTTTGTSPKPPEEGTATGSVTPPDGPPPTGGGGAAKPTPAVIYRSDAQRASVEQILSSNGLTEDDLARMIGDGQVGVGQDGKLTRKGVQSLRTIIDIRKGGEELKKAVGKPAGDTTVAPGATPPTGPVIDPLLRGQFLFEGVDYRGLTGKGRDGRVTKGNLREAKKGRADGAQDDYAKQVRSELEDILGATDGFEVDMDNLRAMVGLLSRDAKYKSNSDDIMSLFDYSRTLDDGIDDVTNNIEEFTKTELKRIERLARIRREQNPDLSKEQATGLARLQVIADRADPNKIPVARMASGDKINLPNPRSPGDRMAEARVFSTAGRSANGRIQSVLRRGTPISKGSSYTTTGFGLGKGESRFPSAANFSREAALVQATSGRGPNVVPYITTHAEKVRSPEGVVTVPKGTTVFADGVTRQSYVSMNYALVVRGEAKPPDVAPSSTSKAAADQNTLAALVAEFTKSGDGAGFRAALDQMKKGVAPEAKVAASVPLVKGDRLLIVRSKTDPEDIRLISPKQATDGKDISSIIGKKGDKADPSNWDIRYVEKSRYTTDPAGRKALFDNAAPEESASGAGMRMYVGDRTGIGDPIKVEELSEVAITDLSDAEIAAIVRNGGGLTEDQIRSNLPAGNIKAVTIQNALARADTQAGWPRSGPALKQKIEDLRLLNGTLARLVPGGFLYPNVERATSVNTIERIFARFTPEETVAAREFIESLGGDQRSAPSFIEGSGWSFSVVNNGKESFVSIGRAETAPGMPPISKLYHEVAHWAYRNILTPEDRVEFWTAMSKYYDENGNAKFDLIDERSLNFPDGPANAIASPQEFFANQFAMWAMQKKSAGVFDKPDFWAKIAKYVQAIFDRFFSKKSIDPDLEPLFSRILPENERQIFKMGTDATPKTKAAEVYNGRYIELRMIRESFEEAFTADSADGIVVAAQDLARHFASVATPSGENVKVAAKLGFDQPRAVDQEKGPTGTLYPYRRLYKMIRGRLADINQVLRGKDLPEDFLVSGEGFDADDLADLDLRTIEDPQAVADTLREVFFNGHKGSFTPSIGATGNPEFTSVSKLLDMMETALEAAYKGEQGAHLPSAIPNSVRGRAKVKVDEADKPLKATGPRKVKEGKATRAKRASSQAASTVNTPRNKRERVASVAGKTIPDIDPAIARELKSLTVNQLRELFVKHRGTQRGDQVAFELVAKERAEPLPPKPVPIPKSMLQMKAPDLERAFLDALYENNKEVLDQTLYEMQRRTANRGLKAAGLGKIDPVFNEIRGAVAREKTDTTGLATNDGVPPAARASVRELLSYVTHRDPDVQYASRTMLYRMLNLMNKTVRGTLAETNLLTAGDIARLAGVDPSEASSSVFADFRSPEFKKLRGDMRRMAIGLTRGESDPFSVVHEVGHVVIRSMLPDNEIDAIRDIYRSTNDSVKQRIVREHGGKYAGKSDAEIENALAEEWFAESMSMYMAERVARGDIFEAAVSGNLENIRLRSTLDRAIDRVVEYVAYVFNGLIGRNDIKQQFRRLTFYGDMFESANTRPLFANMSGSPAVHSSYAAAFAGDVLRSSPKSRIAKIKKYVGNGIGYDAGADAPVHWYHGTPKGYIFRRKDNPEVIVRPSRNGNYGPGFYLTENPDVANEVYSQRPTAEAVFQQISEAQNISEETRMDLMLAAYDIPEIRKGIARLRNEYADTEKMADSFDEVNAFLGKERLAEVRNKLDKMVEQEQSIMDYLAENGIVSDPLVVPTYVRAIKTADFTRPFQPDDPLIKAVVAKMNQIDDVDPDAVRNAVTQLTNQDMQPLTVYKTLIGVFQNSGRNAEPAKVEFTALLEELGYDSLLTVHSNTIDFANAERMSSGITYEGDLTRHKTLIVFSPEQVKHVEADFFDADDARLYHRETEVVRGTNGSVVRSMAEGDLNGIDPSQLGVMAEHLEIAGTSSPLVDALTSIARRRPFDAKEEQAVRKANDLQLQSNSSRMEAIGMNWLASWYKNNFPDLHQTFAKKYFPLHNALRALPDADGKVRAWARAATAGISQKQPESYSRIVKALRFGKGSRFEKQLNDQERKIWNQIRDSFAKERKEMLDVGMYVGDRGPNYLPQVWNKDKIQKNRDEFTQTMMRYYKVEKTAQGILGTDEEARAFAEGLYQTLAGDGADGVFVPVRGGSRNPKFENVDYSRVIELEKYPTMLQEAEKFLEDDLEFLLVKYFEGSSRRINHTKKMGLNSHGFYDYLMAVDQGRDGIVRLLSRNKEYRKDLRYMGESGHVEYGSLLETTVMPFEGKEFEARQFVDQLISVQQEKGSAAARQMLMDIAPVDSGGRIPQTYTRRVDAIIGSIEDYKGQPGNVATKEYDFVENSMRVAMKQPLTGIGGQTMLRASRFLRSFNNVTLLGWTTLTSMSDLVLPIIRSGSFKDWSRGLVKWASDPEYRQMLNDVGVAMENIVHERMVYMYGAVDGKLSNAFFNATMLTPWTDMNRQIAGATAYETFKTMQRKANNHYEPAKELSQQHSQYKIAHRFLTNYGLASFLPGGDKGTITLSDRTLLQSDDELRMALIKFADDSIFQPNPNDIPLWAQTPLGALVFQLKSYPLMMMRMGKDVLYNDLRAFVKGEGGDPTRALYFLSLGPAFGMGALALKDIVQARGGDDERSSEVRSRNILKFMGYDEKIHGNENDFLGWYAEGMMMMGGFGLLGDVIHDTLAQVDNGAYGKTRIAQTLGGPSVGVFFGAIDVAAGAADDSENSNAKERTAMREIATRIPVVGGIRNVREEIVDAVAGEANSGGNTGGWTSSWGSEWK